MTRSLPEKTFEHWCSIHLNYRYRSHLQMWWPSVGPDITAVAMPNTCGKRIWLELKTVEWNITQARHDLYIDLQQLIAYGDNTVPDYYVFPIPTWQGVLGSDSASEPWLGTLPPSQLAYQSRSGAKWFAEWTVVVPGHVLRNGLASEIRTGIARGALGTRRIAHIKNGEFRWIFPNLKSIVPIPWRRFWKILETCGSPEYPAQFIVPRGTEPGAAHPGSMPRARLVALLDGVMSNSPLSDASGRGDLETYSQSADDNYEAVVVKGLAQGFVWDGAQRALVQIEPGGLRFR